MAKTAGKGGGGKVVDLHPKTEDEKPKRDAKVEPKSLAGDNSRAPDETPEEREARLHVHLDTARRHDANLNRWKEAGKDIKAMRNKARNAIAQDFPLTLIDEILEDEKKRQSELRDTADLRYWMRATAGLPVGGQPDLLKRTPVAVKDAFDYEAEGKRAGFSGLPCEPPPHIPSMHVTDWTKGHSEGAEKLAWSLSIRGHIVDRDVKRGEEVAASPVQLDPDEKDDGSPEALKASANKLKASGFMDTTTPPVDPLDAAEE